VKRGQLITHGKLSGPNMKLQLTPYQVLTTWPSSPKSNARGVARPGVQSWKPARELREPALTWQSLVPSAPDHLVMMWGW